MFNILYKHFPDKLKEQEGQGLVEYALIIGFIAISVFSILFKFGPEIETRFNEAIEAFRQHQ